MRKGRKESCEGDNTNVVETADNLIKTENLTKKAKGQRQTRGIYPKQRLSSDGKMCCVCKDVILYYSKVTW